jgi:hypothetical protein
VSGLELGVVVAGNLLALVVQPLLEPDVRVVYGVFGGMAFGFALLWDSVRGHSDDRR